MLEVLEERLVEYTGTLIIVTHDRNFLDNVVTSVLVFEDGSHIQEYVGGYSDWAARGKLLTEADVPDEIEESAAAGKSSAQGFKDSKIKKLSYMLQRELDALPGVIENLEAEIHYLQNQIADPDFYEQTFEDTSDVLQTLSDKQNDLDAAMDRWAELENFQTAT